MCPNPMTAKRTGLADFERLFMASSRSGPRARRYQPTARAVVGIDSAASLWQDAGPANLLIFLAKSLCPPLRCRTAAAKNSLNP
jgi:hypothetical protein